MPAEIEIQQPTTVPTTEPVAIEERVDEEPRLPTDIHIVTDVGVPEEEVKTTVTTPDVPAPVVTVPCEEEIAPAAVSVSGDVVSHIYIVHHDWPRVKLTVPEPKRTLAHAAGEEVEVNKISRTYIVHYNWPAVQIKRPSKSELPTGAAVQAIDSGTDISGEVAAGVAKHVSDKVTATYIVHYDWPPSKVKVEKQPAAGEMEVTQKALSKRETQEVVVDQPEITQPSAREISLEHRQPEEPVLIQTVLVSAPDVEEPELKVPDGEETWRLPVTDITREPPAVVDKSYLEIQVEPAICIVGEEERAVDVKPSPLVVATTVDLPTTTVAETKPTEPPVTEESLTAVSYTHLTLPTILRV